MCATVYDVAGLFDIKVTGDVVGVVTLPKQIKFAAAKANNDTGKQAQGDTIEELDRKLVIRRNWIKPRTRYGINITNAKFSAEIPETVVFTRADWLLEEEGYNSGIKRPDAAGHRNLTIPDDHNVRGSIRNVVPAARKARRILENAGGRVSPKTGKLIGKTGAFLIKARDGRQFIFQRIGVDEAGNIKRSKKGTPLRGRVKRGQSKLELLYTLRPSVTVPETMIMQKTVINTYKVHYGDYFGIDLKGALRGARK